jgi:hypothetical protein
MPIRRPLSPGKGWDEISLYTNYAELAQQHLIAERYFETILICCAGFEVLTNSLPGRIRLYHFDYLTPDQQEVIERAEQNNNLTAGQLVGILSDDKIIHDRLARALANFNHERNNVIHPLERRRKEHSDGTTPYTLCTKTGGIILPQQPKKSLLSTFTIFVRSST